MIHKKRLLYPTLLAALTCGALALALHAETPNDKPPQPQAQHGPPPSPLFDALDTNHDGVISADEIANASTALKALLKNGATQITREDVRPPHPARAEREGDEARPRFHHDEEFRAHRPPPRDEQDADAPRPPRPSEADADDRGDHPHHRPPPPRFADEGRMDRPDDDEGRWHGPRFDREDHPPRPAREDADEQDGPRRHPRMGDNEDSERSGHRPPPPSPLFDALDTNHDGVISADEIANAPESLKKLDPTGSGRIERKDLYAPQPPSPADKK